GGIKGKINSIKKISELNIPVQLINGLKENYVFKSLKNKEINEQRFTIIKKSNLLFVANSSKLINQKKINRELEKILKKFLKLYAKEIEDYRGQIGAYSDFKDKIQDSLAENS
ncbi:unnamed protein product, partial [marine sediment metagenome]